MWLVPVVVVPVVVHAVKSKNRCTWYVKSRKNYVSENIRHPRRRIFLRRTRGVDLIRIFFMPDKGAISSDFGYFGRKYAKTTRKVLPTTAGTTTTGTNHMHKHKHNNYYNYNNYYNNNNYYYYYYLTTTTTTTLLLLLLLLPPYYY